MQQRGDEVGGPIGPSSDPTSSVPHRLAASILLAIGLLAAGEAAMVNAASPDPSASAAPSASAGSSSGSGGTQAPANNADCPNM